MMDLSDDDSPHPTPVSFPVGMWCFLLNLPADHEEWVTTGHQNLSITHHHYCLHCSQVSKFWTGTGEGLKRNHYFSGRSHVATLATNGGIAVIGGLGFVLSLLIIAVLRRKVDSPRSFDILLAALAWFDMACCASSVVFAVSLATWLQNWNRSFATLVTLCTSWKIIDLAKSGSSLIIIVLSVERYVGLAHPFTASRWLNQFKTKWLVGAVAIYTGLNGGASLLASTMNIGRNHHLDDPGIESVTATRPDVVLAYPSPSPTFDQIARLFDAVELFVPIPVLLVLNGMIFYKIRKISAERAELCCSQKNKGLNAGKMFSPIVAVHIICTAIIPIAAWFSFSGNKVPTEILVLGASLLHVLDSAVKFPIYYWTSERFRRDVKILLKKWFICRGEMRNQILE